MISLNAAHKLECEQVACVGGLKPNLCDHKPLWFCYAPTVMLPFKLALGGMLLQSSPE